MTANIAKPEGGRPPAEPLLVRNAGQAYAQLPDDPFKIQEESLYYEHKKHDGSLPLVGVNTFLPKDHVGDIVTKIELIRSTPDEKAQQIANVASFVGADVGAAEAAIPARKRLETLQQTARDRQNVFTALMEAVKTHSLGQISHALYEVGGEYRRNM